MLACHCTCVLATLLSPPGNMNTTMDVLEQDRWDDCHHMPSNAVLGLYYSNLKKNRKIFVRTPSF